MPGIIRSNSAEVSQRRPMLGFTVRTGGHPFFEVAVATAPDLFRPDARGRRTHTSFWSSRGGGPLAAERGEAVYMLPADVLLRFAGSGRLYYAIATFPDAGRGTPTVQLPAPELVPYVVVSPDFTARTARAMAGSGAGTRWNGGGNGYGAGEAPAAGASLEWAGDAARPGVEASTAAPAQGRNGYAPTHNGSANGNGGSNGNGASHHNGNGNGNGNGSHASAGGGNGAAVSAGLAYDDGFDPDLWSRPMSSQEVASAEDEDAGPGIEGPIPDDEPAASGQGWAGAMTAPAPEYPGASRFVPAHSGNFRSRRGTRTVRRVVIHITDGNRRIEGPISWFQNPQARVSAHYIVGQDGEVVQMVRHDDVAWHAGNANGDSIGIEHVASRRRNILPTVAEYCASARLVRWLCQQYGLPLDRQHIVGHSEADTRTTHTGCPASAWDWDYFMGLVLADDPEACRPAAGAQSLGAGQRVAVGRIAPAGALAQVAPGYAPSDPQQALAFMQDWGRRVREWKSGVPETRIFPHSAICQLRVAMPGGSGVGTGFYIGPDRILTCAHNVIDWASRSDATSIEVIPGRNGSGGRPFPSFTVQRPDWTYHPGYDGTRAFDLAVIRVNRPPPNGAWFEIEELNQSIEAPIVVCGYAAETVDEDRQHLDGDHIRSLGSGGETLQYNLQTEAGNSGSPVFYIRGREDEQLQMSLLEAVVIGVHVSAYDDRHNNACRLTADKIGWIRGAMAAGQSLAYGAGVHRPVARPLEVVSNVYRPADRTQALQAQADFAARRNRWRAGVDNTAFFPHSAICHFELDFPSEPFWGTGFYIAPDRILTCAHNIKSFGPDEEVRSIRVYPGRNGQNGAPYGSFTVQRADIAVHERYNGGHDWDLAVLRVSTPPPNGEYFDVLHEQTQSVESPIIVCGYSAGDGGDPYRQHLDGDTIRRVEDQTFFYNLQTTGGASGSPVYYVEGYEDHDRQMSVQRPVITGVHVARAGNGDPDRGFLNRACRLTDEKIRWIRSRFGATAAAHAYGGAQGRGTSRALNRSVDFDWDDLELMGQPNSASCWATAASMLLNWKAQATTATPQELAHSIGMDHEYANGCAPHRRRDVARALGLETAPPQSWSVDAFIDLVETRGPLFVAAKTPWNHVVVVTGILSDGNPDGSDTRVRIADPWDRAPGIAGLPDNYRPNPGGGSRYTLSWADFTRMYEDRISTGPDGSVNVQILHHPDTGGRRPSMGSRHAYAAGLGTGRGTSRALEIHSFQLDQVETVRREFVANASSANRQNCITIVNSAMRALYGGRITGGLGSTIHDTMGALQRYGLADTEEVFQFLDARGRLTRGVVRPDRLQRSIEAWILAQAEANQASGHYLFGLSVMDGYHSVILGLSFSGTGNPDTRIYWADQVHGGWDDVTGSLDARITSKTQGWWDPLPADRKARTRSTVWPLIP